MKLKTKKFLVASFITILMITSIAGFVSFPDNNNSQEKKAVNGVNFIKINERWFAEEDNKISILVDPDILKDESTILDSFKFSEKLYLSTNPKQNLAKIGTELNVFFQILNKRIIPSCYEDSEECKTLLIKNCKDATTLNKIIIIKIENQTNINYENNCLNLTGKEDEIINFIDSLIISDLF